MTEEPLPLAVPDPQPRREVEGWPAGVYACATCPAETYPHPEHEPHAVPCEPIPLL